MAMIAVEMVVNKLATILEEEVHLLGGVRDGIDELKDDLESMKSFLKDAEARSESDEGIKTWVKQVRCLAYDTEDVLEVFLLRLSPPQGHGCFFSLHKCYHDILKVRTRHRLALQIKDIKDKAKAISKRRVAFYLKSSHDAIQATTSSGVTSRTCYDPRVLASLFIDESDVVGIENPRSTIIDWLVYGAQSLTPISVVGMGGLGKTTLVRKAYDSPLTKKHFDCHAWITISKSFTAVELLRDALKGFLESTKEPPLQGIDTMGDVQLVTKLREHLLGKRYVAVFDDIWNIDAWEAVKFAFPDCNSGSRIIFTTRIYDVTASVETLGHVYHLQPLSEVESWTLFCMKAFCRNDNGICPAELEDLSRSILKKCGGLPLAIVTIGSLLSKKNRQYIEWKKIHDCLAIEMKTNSSLVSLEKILLLSYNDLPYYLKICYLYLSVFPEDYLIKRMKLIRLWVVERFVEEKPGLTMEEVAEDYLNELVSRSLIQVVQMDYFNRVKTCRIHDLMREIIQLKSKDESLITTLDEKKLTFSEKIRRVSIHDSCGDFPSKMNFPRLRSLLVFAPRMPLLSTRSLFSNYFKLLRVLELESAPLSDFAPELIRLIHLRYLSLRRTLICELPNSIGKLKNLEILDLKGSLISCLPEGILQMERLIQLRHYRHQFQSSSFYPDSSGMTVPAEIGKLTSLQKLGSVEVNGSGQIVRELGKLTQLKRLGILRLRKENGMDLCESLEKMKHLTALYMVSLDSSEALLLNSLSSPPRFLQRMYLKCRLPSLPSWISSLKFLGKLVLQYSALRDDPLKSLQEMPNLVVLELREAYTGFQLCCGDKGFPRMKKLSLYLMHNLASIKVEKGAMPGLRTLEIVSCNELEMVPLGIEHLSEMHELLLWAMPPSFVRRIEQPSGEDLWKVQHIPTVMNIEAHVTRRRRAEWVNYSHIKSRGLDDKLKPHES